jgi:hypothetical protein
MQKAVHEMLESLLANSDRPSQPVNFEWRLIKRNQRPFLLLRPDMTGSRAGLNLYAAQRIHARILRALLPVILQTPAANFFERIHFQAGNFSEMLQFMAQQAGTPAGETFPAAIKLSEAGARLVLLLCDKDGQPTRVIKVGLDPASQQTTNQEADFLEKIPQNMPGCVRMTGRLTAPTLAAFAMEYFSGKSPDDCAGLEFFFHAWLNSDARVPIESLSTWRTLSANASHVEPVAWPALNAALMGKKISTTLYHGDFAPWNIRVNAQGKLAFDWENGCLQGIPGWDWFHFIVQTSILVKRKPTRQIAAEAEQLMRSQRFQKYASMAGICDIIQPLFLAYLLHQKWVIKPRDGRLATAELFEFLFIRWSFGGSSPMWPTTQGS